MHKMLELRLNVPKRALTEQKESCRVRPWPKEDVYVARHTIRRGALRTGSYHLVFFFSLLNIVPSLRNDWWPLFRALKFKAA